MLKFILLDYKKVFYDRDVPSSVYVEYEDYVKIGDHKFKVNDLRRMIKMIDVYEE